MAYQCKNKKIYFQKTKRKLEKIKKFQASQSRFSTINLYVDSDAVKEIKEPGYIDFQQKLI